MSQNTALNMTKTQSEHVQLYSEPPSQIRQQYLKQVLIESLSSLDRIDNSVEKLIFKIFDRAIMQECSKRCGYFDSKFLSFERPYGQQTKRECLLISKYIHSKCLAVRSLQLLLPELDVHKNQIEVDDETVDKLFQSIGEIAISKKLQILEIDLKRWRKCSNAAINSISSVLSELFLSGTILYQFTLNLDNWKEINDEGSLLLSNSLQKLSLNASNLTHISLSFEDSSAEALIKAASEIVKKSHVLETFKLSLWNWTKCADQCCALAGQLMIDLSESNKLINHVSFNFFGWSKSTDVGMKSICDGVSNIFKNVKRLLQFSMNISSWRDVSPKGVDLISKTFSNSIFNLQPYLVEANVTFAKSDKIMQICSKYLRQRYLARMQFLVFYKNIEWHVNKPTEISQDLYFDTLNKQKGEINQLDKPQVAIELKANIKMLAYKHHQQQKYAGKETLKRLNF